MAPDLRCLRVPSALQTSICKRRWAAPPPAGVQLKFTYCSHWVGGRKPWCIGGWLNYKPGDLGTPCRIVGEKRHQY